MTDSLFTSLRIVAFLLTSDRELHPLEKSWYTALVNTCGPSSAQRKILHEDLAGRSKVDIEALYFDVVEEKDRKDLARFLKVASRLDGKLSPEEKIFLSRIQDVSERFDSSGGVDYVSFGKSLMNRDRELRMWNEIREGALLIGQRRGLTEWAYPYGSFSFGLLLVWLVEISIAKKGPYIVLFLFFATFCFYKCATSV